MKIIEELFTQEYPSGTDTIKFVDPIKKKISYFDLKDIGDPSYFDEPLFKAIEVPKELVLAIFKRGFDAATKHFVELINKNQKE
jgi:hypothetical protein